MTKTKKRAKYKKGDLPLPTLPAKRVPGTPPRPPRFVWVVWARGGTLERPRLLVVAHETRSLAVDWLTTTNVASLCGSPFAWRGPQRFKAA